MIQPKLYPVLLLLGALAGGGGFAAPAEVANLLRESPTLQDYPEAAALILFNDKTVTWGPDGTLLEQHHTLTKILQGRGLQRYQDFNLLHRRPRQEARVIRAGVYRDAANFQAVEAAAVREMSAVSPEWAGLYGDLVRKSFTYPAAPANAFLEVQAERSTAPPVPGVSGIEFFQADDPVLERRFQLVLPRESALSHRVLGPLAIDLMRTERRGETVWAFYAVRSPLLKMEPSSPPFSQQAGRLVFSTFSDWSAAARPFRQAFENRDGSREQAAALARKLTEGVSGGLEKLRRIHQYLSRRMRSVELGLHQGGYQPHAPDEVLRAGYGDRLDKAVLAAALLDAAGFEYQPVLLNSQYAELAEEVPALEQFDAVLLRVALPDKTAVFLDPFTELDDLGDCPYLPGNRGLILAPDGCRLETLSTVELPSVAENALMVELAADGSARLAVTARLSGMFASAARFYLLDKTPEETDAFFTLATERVSARAAAEKQAALDLATPGRPVRLELMVQAPDLGAAQGSYLVLALPEFPLGLAVNRMFLGLEQRQSALWLGYPSLSRVRVEVRPPADYEAVYLPPDVQAGTDWWSARKTFRWDKARRVVVIEEEVRVKSSALPSAAYPETRRFFAGLDARANQFLILRRAAP